MRRLFNGLVIGLLVGGVAGWFLHGRWSQPAPPEVEQRLQTQTERAIEAAGATAYHLTEAFKAKLEALDLDTDEIRDELAHTGQVVRRRARELAEPVVDAAADARITTTIKSKLVLDRELSARDISVTTDEGHVILEGTVASPDLIGRAMLLTMETDGVREVTSKLQVEDGE